MAEPLTAKALRRTLNPDSGRTAHRAEFDRIELGDRAADALRAERPGRGATRRGVDRVYRSIEVQFTWARLARAQGISWHECVYCGAWSSEGRQTRDHVIPLSRGGANGVRNVVPACRTCNTNKNDLLITEWQPDRVAWHPFVLAAIEWDAAGRPRPDPTPSKAERRQQRAPDQRRSPPVELMPAGYKPLTAWCLTCRKVVDAPRHDRTHPLRIPDRHGGRPVALRSDRAPLTAPPAGVEWCDACGIAVDPDTHPDHDGSPIP